MDALHESLPKHCHATLAISCLGIGVFFACGLAAQSPPPPSSAVFAPVPPVQSEPKELPSKPEKQSPGLKPAQAPVSEDSPDSEPEILNPGMSIQEWNRTAVKDLTSSALQEGHGPRKGQAPPPTAEEKRGLYQEAPGIVTAMDDPAVSRVYPIQTIMNHSTLIQLPAAVAKVWCGDLQAWTVEGDGAFVTVKPLAPEASTNIHCLTTEGATYNFRLFSSASGQ